MAPEAPEAAPEGVALSKGAEGVALSEGAEGVANPEAATEGFAWHRGRR